MKNNLSRREFMKWNSVIGLSTVIPFGLSDHLTGNSGGGDAAPSEIKSIEREIILHGRRNNQAWFEPAAGLIPGDKKRPPDVFVRATLLTGDDIGPQLYLKTGDLGKTWSNPALCQNWFKIPLDEDVFEEPWFGFFHHRRTGKFMAIGQTHFVQDKGDRSQFKNEQHYRSPDLRGSIVYSLWNPAKADFEPWKRLELPPDLYLRIYYNGQFHEQDDGTILLPGYFGGPSGEGSNPYTKVTVLRCRFTGSELQYMEHVSIHTVEEARGLAEPSIVKHGRRYFMTVRHNLRGYVTSGTDGLHFDKLKIWCFDDGEELGNYNTQQKWLKHREKLYLIYNRKSELNNGVFRSRAPLFMAEVDPDRLMVQRNTERVVFPENRARMGNFNTVDVTENESWIISGEWLEGMFPDSKKGDRFWVDNSDINYIQYIGDLLLARVTGNKGPPEILSGCCP